MVYQKEASPTEISHNNKSRNNLAEDRKENETVYAKKTLIYKLKQSKFELNLNLFYLIFCLNPQVLFISFLM